MPSLAPITPFGIGASLGALELNALRARIIAACGIRGLLIASSRSNPDEQIDISCALARLSGGSTSAIAQGVSLSLDITSSGANGLDAGSAAANTGYYLWLTSQGDPATGLAVNVAGLFSLSNSSPSLPRGHTHKRLVGYCRTDSARDIIPFVQEGSRWRNWGAQLLVYSRASRAKIKIDLAGQVPPEARYVLARLMVTAKEMDSFIYVSGMSVDEPYFVCDSDRGETTTVSGSVPLVGRGIDYRIRNYKGGKTRIFVRGCDFPQREPD